MKRKFGWLAGGWMLVGLVAAAVPAQAAGGMESFKLTRAVPADAMLVVQFRDHEGEKFVNAQLTRVWAEVEKQRFDKDIKRLLQALIKDSGGDLEAFDARWQQATDLAAGVEWSGLFRQEGAFALKLVPASGAEWVLLAMPAAEHVATDFDGLAAILKNLLELDTQKLLLHSQEGEGETVIHKVSIANAVVPMSLTLARHKDVILLGFGSGMPEQVLALLRGETDKATATLASTERFKEAFKKLPPPTDEFCFADMNKIMVQVRGFAKMAAAMSATQPSSAPATTQPAGPLAFLLPLVDELDLWDYMASVSTTDGMKTVQEQVTVLREGAKTKTLGQVFYGGTPLRDPLKFVPKSATSVSIGSGLDFLALYKGIVKFIEQNVPEGKAAIAQWDEVRKGLPLDIEQDVLGAIGSGYGTFSAPIPTPFMPGTVFMLPVRDPEKAQKVLDWATEAINGALATQGTQGAGVEDARIEGAEGFKQVILPPLFAMVPGLGQPIYGIQRDHLFLANGPKVLSAALKTAAGTEESFEKNERFREEGLPLAPNMTGFSFQDLSNFGEELGQMLSMVGVVRMMVPDLGKNPAANTALTIVTKLGSVVKKLDFYRSKCAITTMDGNVQHTKTVTHYQEPPKPKTPTSGPAEEPTSQPAATPPAKGHGG